MRLNFGGRLAVVTCGASGIGRAAAQRLAEDGARVLLLDCDETALRESATELGAIPVHLDITDRAASSRAIHAIESEHGPIAVLVTAAGVLDAPRSPERITESAWERTFAVNLEGTRIACELVGSRMAERGQGAIVTVASIAAIEPRPLVIYGPAKA